MFSLIIRGRRNSPELHKWHNLRASLKAFLSSFSSASVADVSRRKGNSFTVSYLVESLGFTTKLAESIFRRVTTTEEANKGNNPDSVLSLLRSHGFTDSHISTIIRTYPRLLLQDAESSLAPKLRFLTSRGASTSELTEILSKAPKILGIKKDKAFSRYYDFVREIISADSESSEFGKLSEGSAQENKLRNVLVLRDMGVPQRLLLPLLISNHHVCCGKEKFEETLKKVVEMGFEPATFRFVEALRMLYQLSDKTIQEKLCFYEKLGFSVGEVWEMFKKNPSFLPLSEKNVLNSIEAYLGLGFTRDEFATLVKCHPQCLNYSAELVKKKAEFLVKGMNWPVKALVSNPTVLGYNLEKRTIPRCNVIKALMSRGLLGGEGELPSLGSVLVCTDRAFLKRYVMKHDDGDDKKLVAELMDIFHRRSCFIGFVKGCFFFYTR
ncbi:Mitochondrial transcription termination factor family protein [Raphanus sativus]|nr:Mitochondrial transcription termination factor family protein [Raphanus sativus]